MLKDFIESTNTGSILSIRVQCYLLTNINALNNIRAIRIFSELQLQILHEIM